MRNPQIAASDHELFLYSKAQISDLLLVAGAAPLVIGAIYYLVTYFGRRRENGSKKGFGVDHSATYSGSTPDDAIGLEEMRHMERAASDMTWLGAIIAMQGIWLLAIVVAYFQDVTERFVVTLDAAADPTQTLILLLLRTLTYGSFAGTALYLIIRFSTACFDQATRYRKRRTSAVVFNYIFSRHDEELKSKMTPKLAIRIFKVWNEAIESAFTSAIPRRYKSDSASFGDAKFDGGGTGINIFNYDKPTKSKSTDPGKDFDE